jgi:hypothetical protein
MIRSSHYARKISRQRSNVWLPPQVPFSQPLNGEAARAYFNPRMSMEFAPSNKMMTEAPDKKDSTSRATEYGATSRLSQRREKKPKRSGTPPSSS